MIILPEVPSPLRIFALIAAPLVNSKEVVLISILPEVPSPLRMFSIIAAPLVNFKEDVLISILPVFPCTSEISFSPPLKTLTIRLFFSAYKNLFIGINNYIS